MRTFASRTFGSRTFAARTWHGSSVAETPVGSGAPPPILVVLDDGASERARRDRRLRLVGVAILALNADPW